MSKKIEVQKTEVVSIKLRIKGKEIDLSLDEARELKDALGKVFAEPVTIKEYVPYYPYLPYEPYKPYEPWIQPYITWTLGTGGTSQEIQFGPNTTSGTLTVGNAPEAMVEGYENIIRQYCSGPTDATCDLQGCYTINVGGN